TFFARFSGSALFRNSAASSALGTTPFRLRLARRSHSASLAGPPGLRPFSAQLAANIASTAATSSGAAEAAVCGRVVAPSSWPKGAIAAGRTATAAPRSRGDENGEIIELPSANGPRRTIGVRGRRAEIVAYHGAASREVPTVLHFGGLDGRTKDVGPRAR